MKLYGEYFCGNRASEYAIEHGYLDYETLAKGFNHVMANDLITNTAEVGFWEPVSGYDYEDCEPPEVFQWFIIDPNGVDILTRAGEIIYYNDALSIYLWGVTHWGTSWDYVLTNIKLNCGEAAFEEAV